MQLLSILLPSVAMGADLAGTGALSGSSIQSTLDTELRYHHVDDKLEAFEDLNIHDYFEHVGRLNLLLTKGDLTLGAQLDAVALYANRYILDGELYHSWDLSTDAILSPWDDAYLLGEKLFVSRRWSVLELTVGDAYTSFGRGMALNIVKNTDVDTDTSIRGVRAVLRTGAMDTTLVGGWSNRQQISQDFPNLGIDTDPAQVIAGARTEYFGLGPANIGAHVVTYGFTAEEGTSVLEGAIDGMDATVAGVTAELVSVAGVDWFVEGDLFDYRSEELSGSEDPLLGYGVYASASAYPGKTVVLVEAKRTRDTERLNLFSTPEGWEAATVPTLEYERVITEDGSAAVNSNDLVGLRVRADYALRPREVMPYISVSAFRDAEVGGLHFNDSPERILHPVGGIQLLGGERTLQLNTGYRVDQREDASEGADRMAHVDGDVHVPLGGKNTLELALAAKRFQWGVNEQQQSDFLEMENAFAIHHGEHWVFIAYQDWSDNPLIRSQGNIADNLYGALEAQYKPSTSTTLKAFYGAYKAGIRCSGGQCKSLPGFQGARVSMSGTF
ncbi:MAG: hypothetical protein QGG40_04475 [Myxococcota bacterium]|nr:hypothetical protein [Myxococcota bacterium]